MSVAPARRRKSKSQLLSPAALAFAQFLTEHHACTEGYLAVHGLTEAEFVRTTKRGDWLEWLIKERFGVYTPTWHQWFFLSEDFQAQALAKLRSQYRHLRDVARVGVTGTRPPWSLIRPEVG